MSLDSILLTHAEVAVAVAGFASVVAVLQRPLTLLQRQRFFSILLGALTQILSCLTTVSLMGVGMDGPVLWRTASVATLALLILVTAVLYLPMRTLGAHGIVVINVPVTYFVYVLFAAMWGSLLANLFVVAVPGFGLYYSYMLLGLANLFLVFADVVVGGGEGTF